MDGDLIRMPTDLRSRLLPMVEEVMAQVHWQGLQLVAWDVMTVARESALIVGIAIAVRGIDLVGPMKELVRFEPLDTWNPDQNKINRCVYTCVEGLREFRQQQERLGNGLR